MSSFSSILSSIGQPTQPTQASQQPTAAAPKPPQPGQVARPPTKLTNGTQLTPNNTVAGVKRRSEEPDLAPRPKTARTTSSQAVSSPRRGLTKPTHLPPPQNPTNSPTRPQPSRPQQPTLARDVAPKSTPTPPTTANGPPPPKRGFASIMDKAKAAQAAAQAAGPSTIKHQATTALKHLSRRDRLKAAEEAKAEARGNRRAGAGSDRSRSNTPLAVGRTAPKKASAVTESGYKGTMKNAAPAAPQSTYKGTMRPAGTGAASAAKKKPAPGRGRQDDYVEWDEMDDVDDYGEDEEDEGGYGSEGSSDMEGGFDDVEKEELASRRLAQREDLEALAEEDKLKREKEERRRRLASMNKAAAGKRKY